MIWRLLRGIFAVIAAATGLLLAYSFIYALEGTTSPAPTNPLGELGTSILWMLPWTLLYCSGLEDFVALTQQASVFWLGLVPALASLYDFERLTSSGLLTKVAMPLLATLGGSLPHVFRRIAFVFTMCSPVAGVAGVVILYYAFRILLTSAFSTRAIGFLTVLFAAACLGSGLMSIALFWRRASVK